MNEKTTTPVSLDSFSSAETKMPMPLIHPKTGDVIATEAGADMVITLYGKDSDVYRKAQRTITNRRLSKKTNATLTAERLEAEANEVLAHCTDSWNIVYEGEEIDCNFTNAKKVYTNLPWVKEQVDEFVAERSNFLGS